MQNPIPYEDELLTMTEVCEWIKTSERTLQTWRQRGLFPEPDVNVGKTIRWRRSTVLRWLDEQAAAPRGRR